MLIVVLLVAPLVVLLRRQHTGYRVLTQPRLCTTNLRILEVGLLSYHEVHGSFPPAHVADADGAPMHSWRTLIMPYIEQTAAYKEYDFSETWDSDANSREYPLRVSLCPDDLNSPSHRTSYLAVVGPNTAWRGAEPVSLADVTDRTDQTILLVEVANSDVNWFEPRDLYWDELSFRINDPDTLSPSSQHIHDGDWFGADKQYVNVLMVDGSVKRLPADTPPETLKALLTINGGETINDPFLP